MPPMKQIFKPCPFSNDSSAFHNWSPDVFLLAHKKKIWIQLSYRRYKSIVLIMSFCFFIIIIILPS